MQELFVERVSVEGDNGCSHHFDYYVTVDELPVGRGLFVQSYGAMVAEGRGDCTVIPHITVHPAHIDTLLETLIRNAVTPVTLKDVVEDWLE